MGLSKTLLSLTANFSKNKARHPMYVNILETLDFYPDSEVESIMDAGLTKLMLNILTNCKHVDIVHSKVFKVFNKLPILIGTGGEVSEILKNFLYFSKLEGDNLKPKTQSNVSTHFIYKIMPFFDFSGAHEYDTILKTWYDEMHEVFGTKLMQESELSNLDESDVNKQPSFEVRMDFNMFGGIVKPDYNKPETEEATNGFDFDFVQPQRNISRSNAEKKSFGLDIDEIEDGTRKRSPSDFNDFDFGLPTRTNQDAPIDKSAEWNEQVNSDFMGRLLF